MVSKIKALLSLFVCFNLFLCGVAVGDGMQPETTVVVLNEADGEASINVTNTDALPALLHSVIEDIPEAVSYTHL